MIYKEFLIMLLLSSCKSEVIIYKKSTRPCRPSNVQCLSENTYTFCLNKGKHSALLHFVFNCPRNYLCNDTFKYPCVKDHNYDFTMSMLGNSVRIDKFSMKLISDSMESSTVPTNSWSSLTEMFKPSMTAVTLLPTPDLGITGLPTAVSQLVKTELPTTFVMEKPATVSGAFTITGNTTMLKIYESSLPPSTFAAVTTMLPTTTITTEVQNNALKPVSPTIMSEPFTIATTYESDISSLSPYTFRAPTTMLPTNTSTTTEVPNFTSKLIPTTDVSIQTMLPPIILKLTTITPTATILSEPSTTFESTVTPSAIESPIHTPSTTTRSTLTRISKPKLTTTALPTVKRRLTSSAFKSTSSTFPTATDGRDIDLTTIESREAIDVPTRRTVIKIKFKLKRKTTTSRLRRRTTTRSRLSTTPRTSITPARYTPNRINVRFKPTITATRTPATRQWPVPTITVTRSTTMATPTVTATRTTVTRSSTRPTPTVTATRTTVTRSSRWPTPTITATRSTVTRSSTRPTPTVTRSTTRATPTVTRSTTRVTSTVTRSTTRPTPTVTRSTTRPTPTITRSTTRPTPTVTRSTTRPTPTITRSTIRPTSTVTRSTARPTPTVTRSTTRSTPTVTRSTTRSTPTVTATRTTVTARSRRPTITVTGTRSKPAITITRTTPTTTTTTTTTTTASTTTTRRPTVTVTRTTPTAIVTTTTTSVPTTTYVTTTRRSVDPPICTEPGKHPATNCDQYYECVTVWWWHEYRLKTCPSGYSFSEIVGDCVPSDQSECID